MATRTDSASARRMYLAAHTAVCEVQREMPDTDPADIRDLCTDPLAWVGPIGPRGAFVPYMDLNERFADLYFEALDSILG